jgi:hypothetical protein
MDRMSSIMVKLERKEQKPPIWRVKCRSGLGHFPQNYYKSSPRRFIVGGTKVQVHSSKMNTVVYVIRATGA